MTAHIHLIIAIGSAYQLTVVKREVQKLNLGKKVLEINLPHKFAARDYQLPILRALDSGVKRAVLVWHRRLTGAETCFLRL